MKSMTIDIVEPDYWEPAYFKVDWYFDAYKHASENKLRTEK